MKKSEELVKLSVSMSKDIMSLIDNMTDLYNKSVQYIIKVLLEQEDNLFVLKQFNNLLMHRFMFDSLILLSDNPKGAQDIGILDNSNGGSKTLAEYSCMEAITLAMQVTYTICGKDLN